MGSGLLAPLAQAEAEAHCDAGGSEAGFVALGCGAGGYSLPQPRIASAREAASLTCSFLDFEAAVKAALFSAL